MITILEFWELPDKAAIHCDTAEKATALCNIFNKLGHTWWTAEPYPVDTAWTIYSRETCYTNAGTVTTVDHCIDTEVTVIEFDDLYEVAVLDCLTAGPHNTL